ASCPKVHTGTILRSLGCSPERPVSRVLLQSRRYSPPCLRERECRRGQSGADRLDPTRGDRPCIRHQGPTTRPDPVHLPIPGWTVSIGGPRIPSYSLPQGSFRRHYQVAAGSSPARLGSI